MDRLIKFLPERAFYLSYFSQDKLLEVMAKEGITIDDISEVVGMENRPYGDAWELVKDSTRVCVPASAPCPGRRGVYVSGYITVIGAEYRVPKRTYDHTKLIKALLPESLRKFPFKVYTPRLPYYELYLPTTQLEGAINSVGSSLYCPFEALLATDWGAVVNRHKSYMEDYYGNTPERKEKFLAYALAPIDSPEGTALREALTTNVGD